MTNTGIAFDTYAATFTFPAADIDAGADPAVFIVAKRDGLAWTRPTVGTRTALSTQATGMTDFSEFAVGEPSADLGVTVSDGLTTVTAGDRLTHGYTITVSNAGPADATLVTLNDSWPSGFVEGSIVPSQGSCAPVGGGPDFGCSLGTIAAGGSATVSVAYTVPAGVSAGPRIETVSVNSAVSDPAGADNSATDTTTVVRSGPAPTPAPTPTPTPAPTPTPIQTLTVTTSASIITWTNQITIAIRFNPSEANRTVQLQRSRDGATWTTMASLLTNDSGVRTFAYRPSMNLYYRAVFAGASDLGAVTSNTTRTIVRQTSVLRSINRGSVLRVKRGASVTFTDTVRPTRTELPHATVRFVFYRRAASGAWREYAHRDVVSNSLGKASTRWNFPLRGEWSVRSQARATPYNANSGWGPIQRFSVR